MMDGMWLACCADDDFAAVRREIALRSPELRMARMRGIGDVLELARAFKGEPVSVALSDTVADDEVLLAAIGEMSALISPGALLVFSREPDAAAVARWFHAGATEVIAAGDAEPSEAVGFEACMREGPEESRTDASSACDDGPDAPCSPEGMGGLAARGDATEAGGEQLDAAVAPGAHRAPLVTVISGRGGCGKTTLVAAMAACAARAGLRAAVLDFDLMFGNLAEIFSVDAFRGFEGVYAHMEGDCLAEGDVEAAAMRVGPGLTLWGPCSEAEHAEFAAYPAERLIGILRELADVIFVDTSTCWGDAIAMAVAGCDRCLVVGSAGASACTSAKRAIDLAVRLGVPHTRMTCVFNDVVGGAASEGAALHFEMGVPLRSRARICYGGEEVTGMLSFDQVDRMVGGASAFARSVRSFTSELLLELGCPVNGWLTEELAGGSCDEDRPKLRLPWKRKEG